MRKLDRPNLATVGPKQIDTLAAYVAISSFIIINLGLFLNSSWGFDRLIRFKPIYWFARTVAFTTDNSEAVGLR